METKKQKESGKKPKQSINDMTESLQRLQADFENYKKWVDSKKANDLVKGKIELIGKMLPLLDQIELAIQNKESENFVKGVELIFSEFKTILEKEGLEHIECVGEKLDPYFHEVMLKEKSDKEDDIVLDELQKGYKIGDVVIRHSKVKVSKK
ncbi:nucleotide exchange factor GrpE [Nanoarchaeota archaeon]